MTPLALALALLLALVVGALTGAAATASRFGRRLAAVDEARRSAEVALATAEDRAAAELRARSAEHATELAAARASEAALAAARDQMAAEFRELADEALTRSVDTLARTATQLDQHRAELDALRTRTEREQLGARLAPVGSALSDLTEQLRVLRAAQARAEGDLTRHLETLTTTSATLASNTQSLVNALKQPQRRGAWGELQLRRTVELAGLVEHCDFAEQASVVNADGRAQRPDLVVHLPGDRVVVVDAKVSLSALLEHAETDDPDRQAERLAAHGRHVRTHIDQLAARGYADSVRSSAPFVVLFVPGEWVLTTALSSQPDLLEHAASKGVVVATPMTLIALLRAIGVTWQQHRITEDAEAVLAGARELHQRLVKMTEHVGTLGLSLGRSVSAYNNLVGNIENRVVPAARRLGEHTLGTQPLPRTAAIDTTVRQVREAPSVAPHDAPPHPVVRPIVTAIDQRP